MKAPALSRRGLVAGIAAAPVVALTPLGALAASDPHPAMVPDLLRLWQVSQRTRFGFDCDGRSPEHTAAEDAYAALTAGCIAVTKMPVPQTIEGLKALILAIGLMSEGYVIPDSDPWEAAFATLAEAVLSATGQPMPVDWQGLRYQPEGTLCA